MALALRLNEYSIGLTKDGSTIYVTDKTGIYNVTTNTGGWGSPNVNLNQSALMVYIEKYKKTGNDVLTSVGQQVVYDATAANDKETEYSFTLDQDGYHRIYLLRLPVSTNGVSTLEGTQIATGEYFYMNNVVQEKTATGSTQITDYSVLISETNAFAPTQFEYKHLVMADLAGAWNTVYKNFTIERDTYKGSEDTERTKAIELLLDKAGAQMTFDAGNETNAENIVETLVKNYVN